VIISPDAAACSACCAAAGQCHQAAAISAAVAATNVHRLIAISKVHWRYIRTKRDHVWQAFSRGSSKNSARQMGSLEDICSRALRRDYLAALDDMFALTLTAGHRGMSFPAEYK
jgi:hypothetical protein